MLTVLNAVFKTTERVIDAGSFFSVGVMTATCLHRGEILTEIQVPIADPAQKSRYKRFAFRKSIDFPVINLAVTAKGGITVSVSAAWRQSPTGR